MPDAISSLSDQTDLVSDPNFSNQNHKMLQSGNLVATYSEAA